MKKYTASPEHLFIRFFAWCWGIRLFPRDDQRTEISLCDMFLGTLFFPVGMVVYHLSWVFHVTILGLAIGGSVLGMSYTVFPAENPPSYMLSILLSLGLGQVSGWMVTGLFWALRPSREKVPPADEPTKVKVARPPGRIESIMAGFKSKICPVWEIKDR